MEDVTTLVANGEFRDMMSKITEILDHNPKINLKKMGKRAA